MSQFRITITEIKPATDSQSGGAESKLFEQVVENVHVPTLIKQINTAPRTRRKSPKTAQA